MGAVFILYSSTISTSPPHRHQRQRSSSLTSTIRSSLPVSTSKSPALLRSLNPRTRRDRGVSVVTRAGPPSANTYIFAFLFPMSMMLATILTSIKIDQKLDQDFLEELAINEAMMEVDAEEESDDSTNKEPAIALRKPEAVRTRNRPKREA